MTAPVGSQTVRTLMRSEPTWFRLGPLWAAGGVTVSRDLVDHSTFRSLCAEAQTNYAASDRQECGIDDHADGRGGMPARALCTAGGGPVQDALYGLPSVRHALSDLCGGPIRPSGNRGSYSYYVTPGDFLDLHLDIVTCDVTLITVLDDTSPDGGGALAVQRHHRDVALSVLRRAGYPHEEVVKAPAGHSIVIQGGTVPHRVLPLAGGQRVISALCFQAAS